MVCRLLEAAKLTVSGAICRSTPMNFPPAGWLRARVRAGGAAGVGGSLAAGVNTSTTKAKIGDYAETNATGTTEVHADSTENVNTVTVAGAGAVRPAWPAPFRSM